MPKYAKNQPVGYKNTIERVAIVGVSKYLNITTYTLKLINSLRLEVPLDRTSPTPLYRPEGTQSRLFPAKVVVIDSPRAS